MSNSQCNNGEKPVRNWRVETKAIHEGQESDPTTGAIITPIFQTSTYELEELGVDKGYRYARVQNPTRTALETCIASLENAKHGLAFSSGLAACSAITFLLSPGDHVLLGEDVYGGVYRLFERVVAKYNIEVSYVDAADLDKVKKALKPNTKILWIETPTNPTLKLADLKALSQIAKANGTLTVVDNTFATPCCQQPLSLGADVVVHSTTKYLNGHSDVIGGALVTNNDEIFEQLQFHQGAVGAVPSPFDCFLVLRGLKTLSLRVKEHERNAFAVARFLETHPCIEAVIYPGLTTHPQHELAKAQQTGFGGVVSCVIKGGLEGARAFLNNTRLFALAESLGGPRSLACHPGTQTHKPMPIEVQLERGIKPGLVRLSVGLEHAQDLIDDLTDALAFVETETQAATKAAAERELVATK